MLASYDVPDRAFIDSIFEAMGLVKTREDDNGGEFYRNGVSATEHRFQVIDTLEGQPNIRITFGTRDVETFTEFCNLVNARLGTQT